jgi:hypothetical protein
MKFYGKILYTLNVNHGVAYAPGQIKPVNNLSRHITLKDLQQKPHGLNAPEGLFYA